MWRKLIKDNDATVPDNVRVSCSFPSHAIRKTIGEAWSETASEDNAHETFISPVLSDPIEVLSVLLHELVHHAVGVQHGHRAPFKRLAVACGLEGKMTATHAGEELTKTLKTMAETLGEYPHKTLNPGIGRKKQSTRLVKCECNTCGYIVRTTEKWLVFGAPLCPCNQEEMGVCS
jgi:hypothetical protein